MHVLFLPGASGAAQFWTPLGALLPGNWEKSYLSWPGLGSQPHDPAVNGFDDLVRLAATQLKGPTVVIAQSMGGIVGVRLAVEYPEHVTHLVLVATSGGIDVAALGGEDWRGSYLSNFPESKTWITTDKPEPVASICNITCPTLLIWGDSDSLSPPRVGQTLAAMIRGAKLHIIAGGDHDLGRARAEEIAPLVIKHLKATR